MSIKERLHNFMILDSKQKLDNWKELISISLDFINSESRSQELAKEIALAIYRHRGLMGSSKAYESAYEIEIELVKLQLPIARIGFGHSKNLIPFLNDSLYYANYDNNVKSKKELEEEISSIQKKFS